VTILPLTEDNKALQNSCEPEKRSVFPYYIINIFFFLFSLFHNRDFAPVVFVSCSFLDAVEYSDINRWYFRVMRKTESTKRRCPSLFC
jgi:hypothetical protein